MAVITISSLSLPVSISYTYGGGGVVYCVVVLYLLNIQCQENVEVVDAILKEPGWVHLVIITFEHTFMPIN